MSVIVVEGKIPPDVRERTIIKRAHPVKDRDTLVAYFLDHLKGSKMATFEQNLKNARAYYDKILAPAIKRGDPVLIAYYGFTDNAIGAIYWTTDQPPFKYTKRLATCHGICVSEDYRGQGVSNRLRAAAVKILKEKGVEELVGMVEEDNEAAYGSMLKFGYKKSAIVMTLDINEIAP